VRYDAVMVLPRIEMIDDDMVRVLRAMTGEERLRIASGMFTSARRMLASQLAVEHPDWDERQIQLETARRLSHEEWAVRQGEAEVWEQVLR
jgi:Rv0078B-related antitoxin